MRERNLKLAYVIFESEHKQAKDGLVNHANLRQLTNNYPFSIIHTSLSLKRNLNYKTDPRSVKTYYYLNISNNAQDIARQTL